MSYQFKWQGKIADVEDGLRSAPPVVVPDSEQLAAANEDRELVIAMVKAYVAQLGEGYEEVAVLVAGHANVDHAPAFGWSQDHVTVTVQAVARGR